MALVRVLERIKERRILKQLFPQIISPPIVITVSEEPTLSLNVSPTAGYVGDTFTFTGYYLRPDGTGIPSAAVDLYRNGTRVGSAETNTAGFYSIPWVADVVGTIAFHTEAPEFY